MYFNINLNCQFIASVKNWLIISEIVIFFEDHFFPKWPNIGVCTSNCLKPIQIVINVQDVACMVIIRKRSINIL